MQQGYEFIEIIGEGSFGTVYLCHHKIFNKCVVKKIQIKHNNTERLFKAAESASKEVYLLDQLDHPRIIKMFDYFCYEQCVYIALEYANKGSLKTLLLGCQQSNRFTNNTIFEMFYDILTGIEYLHIRKVIHRDLKPDNILFDIEGRVKIADFGISHPEQDDNSTLFWDQQILGTPYYMPPETSRDRIVSFKTDIYALGCIFYEICTLAHPYGQAMTYQTLLSMQMNQSYRRIGDRTKDFLTARMLEPNCQRRATLGELIDQNCFNFSHVQQHYWNDIF